MSINTIIEEQKRLFIKTNFSEIWAEDSYDDIWNWYINSIKQLLEAEVERLNKEDTDLWFDSEHCKEKDKEYYELKREFVNDQTTHLTNIIKEIK